MVLSPQYFLRAFYGTKSCKNVELEKKNAPDGNLVKAVKKK